MNRPCLQQLLISPILILLQQYLNKKPQRTNFIKIKDISENVVSDPLAILEDIGVVSGETIRDYTPEKGWKIKDSDKTNIITIALLNHHL